MSVDVPLRNKRIQRDPAAGGKSDRHPVGGLPVGRQGCRPTGAQEKGTMGFTRGAP